MSKKKMIRRLLLTIVLVCTMIVINKVVALPHIADMAVRLIVFSLLVWLLITTHTNTDHKNDGSAT